MLSGGRLVLSLKGNEERKLITSHFSSLYHTFPPFITVSLFSYFVTSPLSSHLLSPCLIHPFIAFSPLPFNFFFPLQPHVWEWLSIRGHVSFPAHKQYLKCKICTWISDDLDVSTAPAVSLGYHSGFICRSTPFHFMEANRAQRSVQTGNGREDKRANRK